MRVIGVTGGVSTGKTTVSHMFKVLGCRVINADKIAHNVIKEERIVERIVKMFGMKVLRGKKINRSKLAEQVFKSQEELTKLERIIHPRVTKEIKKKIKELKQKKGKGVIVDVPLLFEVGLDQSVDVTVVVKTTQSKQIQWAQENLGLSRSEARKRIKAQMPLKDKIRQADFIIDNSKDLNKTRKQVNRIWQKLQ